MKCFNNLSSPITINIDNDNVDNDKGTVIGSTVSVETIKPGEKVIPIDTKTRENNETLSTSNPDASTDSSTQDDTPLTQSLNLTNVTGFIDDTTNLNYNIIRPIIDTREVLSSQYYNINCSVGLYQTNILPSFVGSCIIEFYRTISTGDVVLDSKYLNILTELDEISYLNAFNSWEYIDPNVPELDFTTTKVLRLNFNVTYFINNKGDMNYEDWLNLGVRVRGIDGSGNIGFCTAITLFTP